jgi:hypothetical protein
MDFCRHLGFSIVQHPDDPAAFRVALDLDQGADAPKR